MYSFIFQLTVTSASTPHLWTTASCKWIQTFKSVFFFHTSPELEVLPLTSPSYNSHSSQRLCSALRRIHADTGVRWTEYKLCVWNRKLKERDSQGTAKTPSQSSQMEVKPWLQMRKLAANHETTIKSALFCENAARDELFWTLWGENIQGIAQKPLPGEKHTRTIHPKQHN